MTIQQTDIDVAVARLIPQTVVQPADGTSATRDIESAQQQVIQMVLGALLSDTDAVYGLAYLVAQRVREKAVSLLTTLDALLAPDAISALVNDPWQEPSSWANLTKAMQALLRLRAQLGEGRFSEDHVVRFTAAVDSLMTDVVEPALADGGTRTQAEARVRALLDALKASWGDFLEARQQMADCLESYDIELVRAKYAQMVVNNSLLRLASANNTLSEATSSERASLMPDLAVDLAVARAAVGQSLEWDAASGTIYATLQTDGYTEPEYLVLQGEGTLTPTYAVWASETGRFAIEPLATGTHGTVAVYESLYTNSFWDTEIVDHRTVFSTGMFLTFPDIGYQVAVTHVSEDEVVFQPNMATPSTTTGMKWLLTEHRIGALLGDDDHDLVDTRTTGRTPSTAALEGAAGTFPPEVRAQGAGAGSFLQSGPDGVTQPYVCDGAAGVTYGTTQFTDSTASFLTDGVQVGDTIVIDGTSKTVAAVVSETEVTLSSTMTAAIGRSWLVRVSDATLRFYALGASFYGVGTEVGHVLLLLSPPSVAGAYEVTEIVDDHTVKLTAASSPYTGGTTPLAHETGVVWYHSPGPDIVCFDEETFLTSLPIEAGDLIAVDGYTYAVAEVLSPRTLQIDTTWADVDAPVEDEDWVVLRGDGLTRTFEQGDFDFSEEGVSSLDSSDGRLLLYVGEDAYEVESILSATQLRLVSDVSVSADGKVWRLRASSETSLFEDPVASLQEGSTLRVFPGTSEQRDLDVISVETPHRVTLSGKLPENRGDITYQVFLTIVPGMEVLAHGVRSRILGFSAGGNVVLDSALPLGNNPTFSYRVLTDGADIHTSRLTDTSNAGEGNFTEDWIGYDVDINAGNRQVTAKVVDVTDSDNDSSYDTFVLDRRFRMNGRRVSYLLRKQVQGTTYRLYSPTELDIPSGSCLAIWGDPQPYTVNDYQGPSGENDGFLVVSPPLASGLTSVKFSVGHITQFSALQWHMFRQIVLEPSADAADETALRGLVAEAIFVPTGPAVSNARDAVSAMRSSVQSVVDVIDAFKPRKTPTTQMVIDLLSAHRYDYAVDLLLKGDFAGFISLVGVNASYASRARAAVQDAARTLSFENVSEVGSAMTSSRVFELPDASQGQIALARSVADMTAESRTQTASSTTLDDVRNQALYQIAGETTHYSPDDASPLMPWVAETGSLRDRIVRRAERAIATIDALINDAG